MDYPDALIPEASEIYEYFGRRVIEHITNSGRNLAIKLMLPPDGNDYDDNRSEAAMMHYAATHGVQAPKVLGVYDIVTTCPDKPIAVAMVSERVPGTRLSDLWESLDKPTQQDIKVQFRQQLACMRACTSETIGRLPCTPTYNIYNRLATTHFGPFRDEQTFDDWCLARIPVGLWGLQRKQWARWLQKERLGSQNSNKFVLTHCDLTPRNIIVKDGKITGIVDWERSGFFPAYAEYAFAMKFGHNIEKYFRPVLEEVLEPCDKKRLQFTKPVEDRGW
ncbi:hypothetical protein CKM354_000645200 [Cercospora kikuchii]|uniref:Aminoglycoside phosphotransferase domain-containing protein n=1 Tax=Cercospora kikuchii TaxID=84275 RepID=A0A9P3FDF1_9PEZI|nr:uncharacterized protein CKM354_000645200 [Cercospora kikuchii]GIZ43218.1 hypothetical protein CKM354_000645200 [Cercospora kikuchii]